MGRKTPGCPLRQPLGLLVISLRSARFQPGAMDGSAQPQILDGDWMNLAAVGEEGQETFNC